MMTLRLTKKEVHTILCALYTEAVTFDEMDMTTSANECREISAKIKFQRDHGKPRD